MVGFRNRIDIFLVDIFQAVFLFGSLSPGTFSSSTSGTLNTKPLGGQNHVFTKLARNDRTRSQRNILFVTERVCGRFARKTRAKVAAFAQI